MEKRDITESIQYHFTHSLDENKLEKLILSQIMEENVSELSETGEHTTTHQVNVSEDSTPSQHTVVDPLSTIGISTNSNQPFDSNQEEKTSHIMQRKIEPILTEAVLSPSSPSLKPTFKIKEELCSPTFSSCDRVEDFQFTVVEIQTTVNDVKSPSPFSNCCYSMTKCCKKVDKVLICIIVTTLLISCFFLSFPIPLISVGTYYLQYSKYEVSDSDTNSLIYTRFPCFVTGKSKCNADGDLVGSSFRVSFPSFLRDSDQNSTTQSSQSSGKTRILFSNICYSYSNQYVEEKEYICYTNKDESKVTLSEPSSSNSSYYTNIGFQLLLFGVIGLIASICIVVSVCCTGWILIEHKPWLSSVSLTNHDQALREATIEAQIKEKTLSV